MLYARKDFAKLCGVESRELSVYIKRGKVILTRGKVDPAIAENAEFIESRKGKDGTLSIEIKEKKFSAADLKNLERLEEHKQLNTDLKKLEIEELSEKISLLKIKKQTQEGFMIPTSLAKDLMAQHFRSITISFQQGADILILERSKKKN